VLWDTYNSNQQSIYQSPVYNFSITGDPNTQGYNRFKMIFKAHQLFITAPDVILNNQPGLGGTNVNFAATAYSKCSYNVNLSYSVPSGTFFPIGVSNIQATATDDCGNTETVPFMVSIKDADAPTINNVTGISVTNDAGKCFSSFIPVTPTATDNSGFVVVTGTRSDGAALKAPYPKGTTTITWTAADSANNISSITQNITVTDVEAPVITPKAIQSEYQPNFMGCSYKVLGNEFDPSCHDACSAVTISNNVTNSSSLIGAVLPLGKSTVLWNVTDAAGNTSFYTQIINVVSQLTATIPDVTAIASGADANSIYLGYTPASTLTYTSIGAVSYSWSVTPSLVLTGANNLSTVKLTANNVSTGAMLYLTAIDQNGCTAKESKDIHVIDIHCSPKGDKISVCSGGKQQCAAINNSLINLLASGTKLGTCITTSKTKRANPVEDVNPSISAYPNPTSGLFVI